MLKLARLAQQAYEREYYIGAIVYGGRGHGKSIYAMKVAYEVLGDWNKVLDAIVFRLEDVVSTLKEAVYKNERLKILIWDDAGVHASKYLFFDRSKLDLIAALSGLLQVIRTALACMIITTPEAHDVLRFLREQEGVYRIKVLRLNEVRAMAKAYKLALAPSGAHFISKAFIDYFTLRVPQDIYREYMKVREQYTVEAIEMLERALKKTEAIQAKEEP